MLAPHHREDAQLGEIRVTAENFLDAREFFWSETVLLDEFGCNDRICSRLLAGHRRDHTNRCGLCLNGSILQEKVNIDTVLQVQGKRKHQQKETNNEENNPWICLGANRPVGSGA